MITRFNYRGYDGARNGDPLDPERLAFRSTVFELSCAPSVLAQTNQNFDWIIVIDKCLSPERRERVLQCIGHRQRTHLHEFAETDDITGTAWLRRYAPGSAATWLTTCLDDDDTLPRNFVAAIQLKIADAGARLPCLTTFGYRSSLQWELIVSRQAPYGYKCPWHRGTWPSSAGVSMLCQPQYNVSTFSLNHVFADAWFETARGEALTRRLRTKWGDACPQWMQGMLDGAEEVIQKFRVRANPLVESALLWKKEQRGDLFVDLTDSTGPVVITNHYFNDQAFRLVEHKPERSRVTGPESFPNTAIRSELLRQNAIIFGKRWRMCWPLLRKGVRLSPSRWIGRMQGALWVGWRFMCM